MHDSNRFPRRPRVGAAWQAMPLAMLLVCASAGAQTTTAPSMERIRAQAQRMKEYRDVLADRDANVRLAALDEMLKSGDTALREVAYEAAFASADVNMRAIALRSRLFAMKNIVVELVNTERVADEEWQKTMTHFGGPKHSFTLDKADPQTGNVMVRNVPGQVAGQELSFPFGNGAIRLRLGDGAVMLGTMTYYGKTVPARLTLQ